MNKWGVKQYVLLLFISLIFVIHFLLLLSYLQNHNPIEEIHDDKNQVYSLINLLELAKQPLTSDQLKTLYIQLADTQLDIDDYSIKSSITPLPANQSRFDGPASIINLKKFITAQNGSYDFSYKLDNDHWINLNTKISYQFYFISSMILLFELALFGGILFYLFSIGRFVLPLKNFKLSAEQLSNDLHQSPLIDNNGPLLVRETAVAINQLQKRIQHLMDNRTKMIAAISHDLRTPITRLKLITQFIDNQQHATKIMSNLDEMELMINSVLKFATIDGSHEAKVKLDLNALLSSICEDFIDLGHQVSFNDTARGLLIHGRMLSLKRAFINIIDNAIKYGEVVSIKLLQHMRNQVSITFEDEGPGILEEHKIKVFDAYYQAKTDDKNNTFGYGLGLTIAYEIISAHDGVITIENRASKGMRLSIILPTGLSL